MPCCPVQQSDCYNTGVARDRGVFVVSAVVPAPRAVSTLRDTRFCAIAPNVVQPNPSTAGAVAVTDIPSTVSVFRMINNTNIKDTVNNTSAITSYKVEVLQHADILVSKRA